MRKELKPIKNGREYRVSISFYVLLALRFLLPPPIQKTRSASGQRRSGGSPKSPQIRGKQWRNPTSSN